MNKLKHLFVPVGNSEAGLRGVAIARNLVSPDTERVSLFHTEESSAWAEGIADSAEGLAEEIGLSLHDRVRLSSEKFLDVVAEQFKKANPRVDVRMKFEWGEPLEEALEFAQSNDVDLIVSGSGGPRFFSQLLQTGMSGTIARRATCPVLIAGPGTEAKLLRNGIFKSAVVAVDFEEESNAAAAWARKLVLDDGQIHFLHSCGVGLGEPTELNLEEFKAERLLQKGRLSNWVGDQTPIAQRVALHVAMGSPARAICNYAEGKNVGLIVVGSRAHKSVEDRLLGTVVDQVFAKVKVPILAIPQQSNANN